MFSVKYDKKDKKIHTENNSEIKEEPEQEQKE